MGGKLPLMAPPADRTAFVTAAGGFLGLSLVKVLVARGHQVFGLTGTAVAADRVRRAGAVAVMGDVLEAGSWQDEAAADWVFHLPPHPMCRLRPSGREARSIAHARLQIDANLLDAVAGGVTRQVVYVGETACYGPVGPRPITEDEAPHPSAWGQLLRPALDRLEGYIVAGLPIVTAFAGWVYGPSSWFRERIIEPVMSGRRVLQFGGGGPLVSAIHVRDCARALVHLAAHGEHGGRYFLVDNEPVRMHRLAETFARHADRPLRIRRVPAIATRLAVGPILADCLRRDAVFSNIRLRGTGYRFRYPTIESGMQQVVAALEE
jgi:nucleoside-diphosphate-sugar epimerase